MSNYFEASFEDEAGISGDDLNRRYREKSLGFGEPSADWADTEKEIRCIYPGQTITRAGLSGRELHVYSELAYFNPDNMLDDGIRIAH